MHFVTGV